MNQARHREIPTPAAAPALPHPEGGALDFAAVLDRYETPLLRYVGQLLGPRCGEVEDIVQESFLRLHRHVREHGVGHIRQLSTWLYRVAHNLAIDAARRRSTRKEGVGMDEALDDGAARAHEGFDMLGDLVRREACEHAMRELEALPDAQRTAIMLKVIEGMTMREIGEVVGTTPSNVCYHLNQGLATLARRLKRRGVI